MLPCLCSGWQTGSNNNNEAEVFDLLDQERRVLYDAVEAVLTQATR